MAFTFTINGNTYSSDPASSAPDGYRFVGYGYITALANLAQDIVTLMANQVAAAAAKVDLATAQANNAALSAASALSAPGTSATSTTPLTISVGSKALTIQTGKSLVPGMNVAIANSAAPDNGMFGPVTSYNTGTGALVVNATQVTGSGVGVATWTVSISGPAAPAVINELKGADIPSAATINLDAATGNLVHVTGTIPITAITLAPGRERKVVFDAALTLTFNAASLILPGAANIITAPGDSMIVVGDAAGGVRIISYNRASNVPGQVVRSARTASLALAPTDNRSYVDLTSGTFTQAFGTAATLGSGWSCRVGNSGTGEITIPASDGRTNWIMYAGEIRDFYCDGAVLTSRVVHAFLKKDLSSVVFVKPPGYAFFGGLLSAGGAGGYYSASGNAAGGGGGGECFPWMLSASWFGLAENIAIGSGGVGGTPASPTGAAGGNSTIGTFVTSYGGAPGGANNGGTAGRSFPAPGSLTGYNTGVGGNAGGVGGSSVYGGGGGGAGQQTSPWAGLAGGSSVWGGGGGGGAPFSTSVVGAGGISTYAGNGGIGAVTGVAGNGVVPSGGGGGAYSAASAAGAGAAGQSIMWGIV